MKKQRDDGWVWSAMSNETLVAELLVRMKHSSVLAPPPGWGLRLPRSRPPSDSRRRKEVSDSTTLSPTTPLSWSGGGASPSPARDQSSTARSKIIGANDISSIISRRSRKKSFTELKDEESLLLKERISLKKEWAIDEISTLRSTCREHWVTNENLKKMKIDLNSYSVKMSTAYDEQPKTTSGQPQLAVWPSLPGVSSTLATQPTSLDHSQSQPDHHEVVEKTRDNSFLLPDLNMMPCEDDCGSETLYGMS